MAHFTRAAGEPTPQAGMPDADAIERFRGTVHPLDEIRLAPPAAGEQSIQSLERSLADQVASQQWPAARALLKKLADGSPDNHYPWYQLALLNLFLNDEKALAETTAHIEKQFRSVRDPFIRERFTKTFALAQALLPDLKISEAWLESVRATPAPAGE